ncbi:hypothetical protein IJ531_04685 [bacterium]|nr:hypothetical protein [bacterium]
MYIYPTTMSAVNFGRRPDTRRIDNRRIDRAGRTMRSNPERRLATFNEASLKDMPLGYLPSGRYIQYNAHNVMRASAINYKTAQTLYSYFMQLYDDELQSQFGFEDRMSEDAEKYTFFKMNEAQKEVTIGEYDDNDNDPIQRTCTMVAGKPREIRVDFLNREEANVYTFDEKGNLTRFMQDTEFKQGDKKNSSLYCKLGKDGQVSYAYSNSDIEGEGVVDADRRIIYNWDSQFFEDEHLYGAAAAEETITANVSMSEQGPRITRVFSTTAPKNAYNRH